MATSIADTRKAFFQVVLGKEEGYACIAIRDKAFSEKFFDWPNSLDDMLKFVDLHALTSDVYFCPTVLREPKRKKDNIITSICVWADLDECPPEDIDLEPSLIVETSPGRHHGYWLLNEVTHALDVEDANKRLAYAHRELGCDTSGWDLTQLLRVPTTKNQKYLEEYQVLPTVQLLRFSSNVRYDIKDFHRYEPVGSSGTLDMPMPDTLPQEGAEDLLDQRRLILNPKVWTLFGDTPRDDWSKALWQLQLLLFEAGYEPEQVFVICKAAACNKYARDNRSEDLLWKEVVRAHQRWQSKQVTLPPPSLDEADRVYYEAPEILTAEERKRCQTETTFVEDYINWAKTIGDAAWQYHQAGAFIALSTVLSGAVQLPTSFGMMSPNLWFLILADTTLTRKTTAMDLSMDLISEVDPECMLATDGSIEGLLTSLSWRPGKPSVFLRDEFSGLLEMMGKRDYYAGMLETLTKMYDGKYQKRVLRKETLEIKDPRLIVFAGGIKERILSLLDFHHVNSGFLPRFIVIAAESDVSRLKPLGPPTEKTVGDRDKLLQRLRQMSDHFTSHELITVGGKEIPMEKKWNARLTDDAWVRYNRIETALVEAGLRSSEAEMLTPTFDRLCKSGLKAAVLLAASEIPEKEIVVEERHIVRAFYYVEQWRDHTLYVIANMGKTINERRLESVGKAIKRRPGILRSALMQQFHMTAREADSIFATLEQRGMVVRKKQGRGEAYVPAGALSDVTEERTGT